MAETHVSALEMAAWGGFLRTHTMLFREIDQRLVASNAMPMPHYDVLLRIAWAGEDGIRMSELARQVLMTTGGLTRLVDRLEREGLITRTRSKQDLRGYEVRLTPTGRKALARANKAHLKDVRELFLDHVTAEELKLLADIWERIKVAYDGRGQPDLP